MRKLKFRAWDIENEIMIYSDKLYDDYFFEFSDGKLKAYVIEKDSGTVDESPSLKSRELENVTEYTGLTDKNGKEIYEGDIVKQRSEGTFINYGADEETFDVDKIYTGEIVIIASKGVCMRNPKYIDMIVDTTKEHKSNQYINVVQYRCEIIGNIYEDSHLLKQ